MTFNPDEIHHKLTAAGEDWADKKSAFEALSDNTKSVLAKVALNYMNGKMSKAEAELRAQASQEYNDHLAAVKAARRAYLFAQVKYDSFKVLSENRRSQESTRRAEMGLR